MKKIKSLLSFLIHSLVVLLVVLIFAPQIIVNSKIVDETNSYFSKNSENYIVYGLTSAKVEKFKTNEFIDDIYLYYNYSTIVKIGNDSYNNNVLIYSGGKANNNMPFSDDKLIEKKDISNPVFIDYNFAAKNNLSLGDSVEVKIGNQSVEMNVSGIYQTNQYGDGQLMIYYSDYENELVNCFEKFEYNYSYISVNDNSKFVEFMKENYVPEIYMYTIEDFESEIDYLIYIRDYYEVDYYNEANVNKIVLKDISKNTKKASNFKVISMIVLGALVLIGDIFVALIYNKDLKTIQTSTNNYKEYSKIHIFSAVLSLVVGVSLLVIVPSLICNSKIVEVSMMYSLGRMIPLILIFALASIIGCLIKVGFVYLTLRGTKRN